VYRLTPPDEDRLFDIARTEIAACERLRFLKRGVAGEAGAKRVFPVHRLTVVVEDTFQVNRRLGCGAAP
jgi:hypothetical protein